MTHNVNRNHYVGKKMTEIVTPLLEQSFRSIGNYSILVITVSLGHVLCVQFFIFVFVQKSLNENENQKTVHTIHDQ